MIETDINKKNDTKNVKLYSAKAINGATFLGGPLAAGYMISENFKALDKSNEGRASLVIGIIVTILLFGGLYMIPENTINKIPKQLIPLIYTAIIWGIVEWKQGEVLKAHKENGNLFFSGWRAAGIGLISLIIILIGFFGYAYLSPENKELNRYDSEMARFSKNEKESLGFYDHIDTASKNLRLYELENTAIPKWKENIEIIENAKKIKSLPSDIVKQNEVLLRYSELRLKAFQLFKKAIKEDTGAYSEELEKIHIEIDKQLKKLD